MAVIPCRNNSRCRCERKEKKRKKKVSKLSDGNIKKMNARY